MGMKRSAVLILTMILTACAGRGATFESHWEKLPDRAWIGRDFFANRWQDWSITNGHVRLEGARRARSLSLLTHALAERAGEFEMTVRFGVVRTPEKGLPPSDAVGFAVASGGHWKRQAIVGHYGALWAGVNGEGHVFIRDGDKQVAVSKDDIERKLGEDLVLRVRGKPAGEQYGLTATISVAGEDAPGATVTGTVPPERVAGVVLLARSPDPAAARPDSWSRDRTSSDHMVIYEFRRWRITGDKIVERHERAFGPVLFAQHTVSGIDTKTLKVTAQLPPMGAAAGIDARLEVRRGPEEPWTAAARGKLMRPSWTIPFRVENWDSSRAAEFRIVCKVTGSDGRLRDYEWTGKVRREPVDKNPIVVAGFTGHYFEGYPHEEVVRSVAHHKPDLLVFTGDQIYEFTPTFAQGKPLDYLYKWVQWGWAWESQLREVPAICLPDDHDIYQGNIWGAGGYGYRLGGEFVRMVDRTQTSHLPDPYDPTPIAQGIGTYYCAMTYGGISIAVIEDRKFKSSGGVLAGVVGGKHAGGSINSPDFDIRKADVPEAHLLGKRQLRFLREWSEDWRNAYIKLVVSQTTLNCLQTLPREPTRGTPTRDLDSNGWPQSGRNRALREFRRGFAFHLSGDQHLGSIIHYGIDDYEDAGWGFCVPSTANFWVRFWLPQTPGADRGEDMPFYTGRFLDGFGNHMTVYAVANPEKTGREPAWLYDKANGYGLLRLDKEKREITMECWPRWQDPAAPDAAQYPGWPRTISVEDNYARPAAAHLPELEIRGMSDPVVQVVDESTGDPVYTLRIKGNRFHPKVFKSGRYTIKVGELGTDRVRVLGRLRADTRKRGKPGSAVIDFTIPQEEPR